MPHFDDLTTCSYFGDDLSTALKAVSWLSREVPFRTGYIPQSIYAKLKSLLENPWQPFVTMGVHHCDLCQFDAPVGHNNLFVPNGSVIYVCPELTAHYIAAHHYLPPEEFLSAVMACPDTRTIEYKKLLLASGGKVLVSRSN